MGFVSGSWSNIQTSLWTVRCYRLEHLSLKTAFLVEIASTKRVGRLHALSVSDERYRLGPGKAIVTLRPNPAFLPKVGHTPWGSWFWCTRSVSCEIPKRVRGVDSSSDHLFVCFWEYRVCHSENSWDLDCRHNHNVCLPQLWSATTS